MSKDTSFSHDTVIPLVKRIIKEIFAEKLDWVTHEEIWKRLLLDTAGAKEAKTAFEKQENPRSVENVASNMVAWFSQQYCVHGHGLESQFTREKIRRRFAYKPI